MPKPGAARGCAEGPHVPMPNIHGAAGQRHDCSQANNLVSGFVVVRCLSIIHVVVDWLSCLHTPLRVLQVWPQIAPYPFGNYSSQDSSY